MRQGATFVAKPLHDPSGEFAIVLYDPTIDDVARELEPKDPGLPKEDDAPKLDEPLVHKSLADILGLKKNVEDRPKVPVVIDPRLAKILRPHQIEGVKVGLDFESRSTIGQVLTILDSFCIDAQLAWLIKMRMAASWQMGWD